MEKSQGVIAMNMTSGQEIVYGRPEEAGIASRNIVCFLNRLREMDYDLHSFQIWKDGSKVFEGAASPYTLESPHRLLSAAKAIIGALVLFAVDEGKLSFDSPIVDYFADKLPADMDERFKRITVYDLMTMQCGQESDAAFIHFLENPEDDLCSEFFRMPMDCEPGTRFYYNNAVPHLLFFLVERSTGQDIETYMKEKLCIPLGIRIKAQYNAAGVYDPVTTVISANDFLKLGLWYLQKGMWGGRQLIDPKLVEMACARQVWTGEGHPGYHNGKGYCMQLWKNAFGGCRMDGGGGQIALILPEENMLAVIMGNESRADQAIQLFYDEIFSKMSGRPLEENDKDVRMLAKAAEGMSRAPYEVLPHWDMENDFSGKAFCFSENKWGIDQIMFSFCGSFVSVQIKIGEIQQKYRIGLCGKWEKSDCPFILEPDISIQNRIYGPDPMECFLSGGWRGNTFVVVCKSVASMGEYRFGFTFDKGGLGVQIPNGISAGMKQDTGMSCIESVRGGSYV